MDNNFQSINDVEYARSLGYNVDIYDDYNYDLEYENMEYEMTHRFDYEKKTKEYLESLY